MYFLELRQKTFVTEQVNTYQVHTSYSIGYRCSISEY